jgi:hypothetical protein
MVFLTQIGDCIQLFDYTHTHMPLVDSNILYSEILKTSITYPSPSTNKVYLDGRLPFHIRSTSVQNQGVYSETNKP